MQASEFVITKIMGFEGFRAHPYRCAAGVPTIGYGSTFYMNGTAVAMNDPPISQNRAYILLRQCVTTLCNSITNLLQITVNQHQFDSLVDFTYNLGINALKHSTLLRKLNANDLIGAANEFPRWCKVKGKTNIVILNRRLWEQQYFEN